MAEEGKTGRTGAPGKGRAAGRGTIQLLAARFVFLGCGFFVSVILARGLGPSEFGTYGVIMSLLMWIEMVVAAGIPGATARLVPEHAPRTVGVEQAARTLLLVWSLFLFAICWAVAPALGAWFGIAGGTGLFRIAFLDMPLIAVFFAYQGILNGHRLFGMLSVSLIIQQVTKLIGILILLVIGLSVKGALVAHVLATACVLVYVVGKFPPKRFSPAGRIVWEMVRIALPMGLYLVALQVLLGLGLWLLKSLWSGPDEVVGYYVAALNVTRVLNIVPSVLTGVLFASLAWAFAKSDDGMARRYIQGATRFALVLLAPGCLLLMLDAENVMDLLYSGQYAAGGLLLRIQTVAFGLLAFLDILFHVLMAAGSVATSAAVLLALVPVAVVLNLIWIPRYGGVGAAVALAVTILAGTFIAMVLVYRRFGAFVRPLTVVRVGLGACLIGLLSVFCSVEGVWLVPKFIMLLGFYLIVLWILRELKWEDLKALAIWQAEG